MTLPLLDRGFTSDGEDGYASWAAGPEKDVLKEREGDVVSHRLNISPARGRA
jgi:hypothetical protein